MARQLVNTIKLCLLAVAVAVIVATALTLGVITAIDLARP